MFGKILFRLHGPGFVFVQILSHNYPDRHFICQSYLCISWMNGTGIILTAPYHRYKIVFQTLAFHGKSLHCQSVLI